MLRGQFYYFGSDQEAALKRYLKEWPDIKAGRRVRVNSETGITVRDLVDAFLTAKRSRVDSLEIDKRLITMNSVTQQYAMLWESCGVEHVGGFGDLWHSFRTAADGAKDQVAAAMVMGHVDSTMAKTYIERVEDDRLVAVASYVHA